MFINIDQMVVLPEQTTTIIIPYSDYKNNVEDRFYLLFNSVKNVYTLECEVVESEREWNVYRLVLKGVRVWSLRRKNYKYALIRPISCDIHKGIRWYSILRRYLSDNDWAEEYSESSKVIGVGVRILREVEDVRAHIYALANVLFEEYKERICILSMPFGRLSRMCCERMMRVLEELKASLKGSKQIKSKMVEFQKNFLKTEKIREVIKGLGQYDLLGMVQKSNMPSWVKKYCVKELEVVMESQGIGNNMEFANVKKVVETLIKLPWRPYHQDTEISKALEYIESTHYGLVEVKQEIRHFLEYNLLFKKDIGRVLMLVGPAGTGKTTIARSIARALNRDFVHISLAGVSDEHFIYGHSRAYINSRPGVIVRKLMGLKSNNPVILLDEIDKIGHSKNGVSSLMYTLLEILNPESNENFLDHFIDLPYSLKNVLFICTGNSIQDLPAPLLSRLQVVFTDPLTHHEKIYISEHYVVPEISRNLKPEYALDEQVKKAIGKIKGKHIDYIIRNYALHEPGMRKLKRMLILVVQHIVMKPNVTVNYSMIDGVLAQYNKIRVLKKIHIPGTCPILSVYNDGSGMVDYVIVRKMKVQKKKQDLLLGGLEKTMSESFQSAKGFIQLHWNKIKEIFESVDLESLDIDQVWSELNFITLIEPLGVRKDGPSAGINLCLAMLSAIFNVSLREDYAGTGHLDLLGNVRAVGGISSKLTAAVRNGFANIVIPEENKQDLDRFLKRNAQFPKVKLVSNMFEVISNAFSL